jgi:hypothetical protein
VIGRPPSSLGADQAKDTDDVVRAIETRLDGALATTAGIADTDDETAPTPSAVTADTRNSYSWLRVKPVTVTPATELTPSAKTAHSPPGTRNSTL